MEKLYKIMEHFLNAFIVTVGSAFFAGIVIGLGWLAYHGIREEPFFAIPILLVFIVSFIASLKGKLR